MDETNPQEKRGGKGKRRKGLRGLRKNGGNFS